MGQHSDEALNHFTRRRFGVDVVDTDFNQPKKHKKPKTPKED